MSDGNGGYFMYDVRMEEELMVRSRRERGRGRREMHNMILGFNLIWVIEFFNLGLVSFICFLMGMSCHILIINEKNVNSIKNWTRHQSVSYVHTKLAETNEKTNDA